MKVELSQYELDMVLEGLELLEKKEAQPAQAKRQSVSVVWESLHRAEEVKTLKTRLNKSKVG